MINWNEVEHQLKIYESDPALLESFRAKQPELFKWFERNVQQPRADFRQPVPCLKDLSAIQMAMFNNWAPNGKKTKGHPNRYGVCLEIWTDLMPKVSKPISPSKRTFNMRLYSAPEMATRAVSLLNTNLKNPISHEYSDALIYNTINQPNCLFGMIATKSPADGTIYHPHQFMMFDPSTQLAYIQIGPDAMVMPSFDTKYANGDPLSLKVVGQSRFDRDGVLPDWATA